MEIIIPYPVIGFDENGDFYFGMNTLELTIVFFPKSKCKERKEKKL